jgi:hypothetical protein
MPARKKARKKARRAQITNTRRIGNDSASAPARASPEAAGEQRARTPAIAYAAAGDPIPGYINGGVVFFPSDPPQTEEDSMHPIPALATVPAGGTIVRRTFPGARRVDGDSSQHPAAGSAPRDATIDPHGMLPVATASGEGQFSDVSMIGTGLNDREEARSRAFWPAPRMVAPQAQHPLQRRFNFERLTRDHLSRVFADPPVQAWSPLTAQGPGMLFENGSIRTRDAEGHGSTLLDRPPVNHQEISVGDEFPMLHNRSGMNELQGQSHTPTSQGVGFPSVSEGHSSTLPDAPLANGEELWGHSRLGLRPL